MLFEFGFYSSLLLITFSQGIIYSVLLLLKATRTETNSNYWLSLFIFLCSLFVAPWMLGFAGWYDNQPYRDFLFYMPFQHLFFIGPVIYFYTQSLLNPSFHLTKRNCIHLIPGILYLLYSLFMWIYDKYIFKGYYFYKDGMDKDFDSWYHNAGIVSMIIYFVLSIRYYNLYRKLMFQVVSYADSLGKTWNKTCGTPGRYYLMFTGCGHTFLNLYRPNVWLTDDIGDYCTLPVELKKYYKNSQLLNYVVT